MFHKIKNILAGNQESQESDVERVTAERVSALEKAFGSYIAKMEETGADHILLYAPVAQEKPNTDLQKFRGIINADSHQYYEVLTKEEHALLHDYNALDPICKGIVPQEVLLVDKNESYQIARFVRVTPEREKISDVVLREKYYIESIVRIGPKHIHVMLPTSHWSRTKYINDISYKTISEVIEETKKSDWWLEMMNDCIEKWDNPLFPYIISQKTLSGYNPLEDLVNHM